MAKDKRYERLEAKDESRWTFVFCLVLLFAFTLSPIAYRPSPCFSFDSHQIMDELKKAVLAELERSVSGNVELNGIRIIKGFEGLEGDKTYTVGSLDMDGYNGRNKIVFLAGLYDDRKIVHMVQVEAAYDVLVDVFVAAKPLSSGSVPGAADVYTVKQKNSRLSPGAITDIAAIKGRKLRANIAQGVILRADQFSNASDVKRGREVTVLVEGENVLVSTKGVLANDTFVGGNARVLCAAPKKEVNGILVTADTVKVKI